MKKKLTVLVAVLAATVLTGLGGIGSATAAPAKAFIGGGSGILVLEGGNSASACTLTTIGHGNNGDLMGITAGHCGKPGQLVVSETFSERGVIGKITHSNSRDDIALIKFNPSKVVPLRTVRGVTIRRIDTRPISFPTIACKQGRTTGSTCGLSWFSDGDVHFTQICVIEGDSGSPVVVGDRLVGMVNAYYFFGCVGPETGTNIGPILDYVKSTSYGGFTPV
ncbi:MAG: serine protease [Gordonia sp. (in: high G+C Gram-positive bacteria)]